MKVSRRTFLGTTVTAGTAFTVIPSHAMGSALGHRAPSEKLNVAVVGPAGIGAVNIRPIRETENIVALCDVDWRKASRIFEANPNAKQYWDYRKMYDEIGSSIDAVVVATPDHTHAIIAADAMTIGKHVYVQKPLTHSVYESRLLTKMAEKYKVATSMGNQGASWEGTRDCCDWIWNGEIGEVKRVDSFTNRPIWPQGLNPPRQPQWVPETLNWDLFIGPAKMIPYHEIYHPWNWRGWWDFGTGALGDMACHNLHPVFKSLHLGYPIKVQGTSTMLLRDCAPNAQYVRYVFPERIIPANRRVKFPEVEVNWYDGGIRPMMPDGWPEGRNMDIGGGGCIFYGTKDTMVCGASGRSPWLISGRVPVNVPKTQRAVPLPAGSTRADQGEHEMDWVRACKESAESRVETASPFREAGPFNEMVVMGVLAVRLQGLNRVLNWDGANMRFTNIGENDTIRMVIEETTSFENGEPAFGRPRTEPINAGEFAAELIKHTYREGWKLPDMPS